MGRSYKPKYRIDLVVDNASRSYVQIAWSKRYGRASNDTLSKFVTSLEASYKPGGCNSHIKAISYISASIVNQKTGEVVAFYAK